MRKGSINTLFVGYPEHLERAFPARVREKLGDRFRVLLPDQTRESILQQDISSIEVILSTWDMARLDADFLSQAKNLQAVFYAAGTVKGFATKKAYENGISISSAWRANAIPVAEYTLATILLSLKNFWTARENSGLLGMSEWDVSSVGSYGKTVGIVSLGAIGRKVAELLQRHDVRVMAYDPHVDTTEASRFGVMLTDLESLFPDCDVITVHAPSLPTTTGMITERLLQRMKRRATLINTARGDVLDERALLTVLRERPDITAILDVVSIEPLPEESEIRLLKNIVYTPHIAGSLGSDLERMGDWMVEEAHRYGNGEPLVHATSLAMLETSA